MPTASTCRLLAVAGTALISAAMRPAEWSSVLEAEVVAGGCRKRKGAEAGTEIWCRCNSDLRVIKNKEQCEYPTGGRDERCTWDAVKSSCVPSQGTAKEMDATTASVSTDPSVDQDIWNEISNDLKSGDLLGTTTMSGSAEATTTETADLPLSVESGAASTTVSSAAVSEISSTKTVDLLASEESGAEATTARSFEASEDVEELGATTSPSDLAAASGSEETGSTKTTDLLVSEESGAEATTARSFEASEDVEELGATTSPSDLAAASGSEETGSTKTTDLLVSEESGAEATTARSFEASDDLEEIGTSTTQVNLAAVTGEDGEVAKTSMQASDSSQEPELEDTTTMARDTFEEPEASKSSSEESEEAEGEEYKGQAGYLMKTLAELRLTAEKEKAGLLHAKQALEGYMTELNSDQAMLEEMAREAVDVVARRVKKKNTELQKKLANVEDVASKMAEAAASQQLEAASEDAQVETMAARLEAALANLTATQNAKEALHAKVIKHKSMMADKRSMLVQCKVFASNALDSVKKYIDADLDKLIQTYSEAAAKETKLAMEGDEMSEFDDDDWPTA